MTTTDTLPPLTRTTLREQAYHLIRQMIIIGRLAPGGALSERALAEQLGVSRAPVKDALLRLEREGFVVSRPDGRYVKALGLEEVAQLAPVRARLEGLAAELAAAATDAARAQALAARLEAFRDACGKRDLEAFVVADVDIHTTIWEQAGNAYLLNALSCIAAPTFMRVSDCARYADERWLAPLAEHERVVTLVNAGDAEGAGQAMEEHVASAHARTVRFLGGNGAEREHATAVLPSIDH